MNRIIEQSKNKAALYCRLSDDDEQDGTSISIETQEKVLTDYCKQHGIGIHKCYSDDGYTGTNFNRPDFKQMMEDAAKGEFGIIIVKDLSRFGRNYLQVGSYISETFPEMGIRFIAIGDDVDSARGSLDYDLMFPIKNIFNEYYPADCSRKVRQAFVTKAKNGEYIGAHAPYGYRKSADDKHVLEIDETAAAIVVEIFEMAAYKGYGYNKIAKVLTERKVLTPAAYRAKQLGKKYDKDPYEWNLTSIHKMVENEVYLGTLVSGKRRKVSFKSKRIVRQQRDAWIVNTGTHPAVISEKLWMDAKQTLGTRKHESNTGFDNIFAGLLRCDRCGYAINATGKQGDTHYYMCNTYKKKGAYRCTSHYILDREIRKAVLADIQDILRMVQEDKEAFYETVMSKISATETKNAAAMQREARDLEERVQTLERKYDMMYEDRLSGIISDTKFRDMAAKCEEEQRAAEARLQELRQSIEAIGMQDTAVREFIDAAEKYTTITELDRELLHTLVDSIVIGDRVRTADGIQQTITVNYKFMGRTAAVGAA